MARWLCLRKGTVKTDDAEFCVKEYDVITLESDEISPEYREFVKPLEEARREFYSQYARVLHELEMVEDEAKEKAPKFFDQIQQVKNLVEEGFTKEDYHKVVQGIRSLKGLYLMAMRGQY